MSIGPSLQARERTTTTTTAQTTDESPDASSFALRYAKRSFEPYNTHPCPEMFADKWATDV
jgi:hypothetical protein